jgi:hypothetical protein
MSMFSIRCSRVAPGLAAASHDDVDEADVGGFDGRQILGVVAARQDSAVDGRVQGLDPPAQHLGKAGHGFDRGHRNSRRFESLGRAAG